MITTEKAEAKGASLARRMTRECQHDGPGALRHSQSMASCSCECKLRWNTYRLAFEAGIPRKFWDFDASTIDTNVDVFREVIEPWPKFDNMKSVMRGENKGFGLYLYGPNGVGKSTFLAWILMELIRNTGFPVYYTTTLRLIADHQSTFGSTAQHAHAKQRLEAMLGRAIVVVDEFGKETYKKGDSFSRMKLEKLIGDRRDASLPTLIASNRDLDALAQVPDKGGYGPTMASIITGHMLPVPMEPGDRRVKLGADSMEKML